MRLANKIQASKVVILGDDEVRSKRLTVRDMSSKEQIEQTEVELVEALRSGRNS